MLFSWAYCFTLVPCLLFAAAQGEDSGEDEGVARAGP
jgi:hypothetical protein